MVLEESTKELERGDVAPDFSLPGTDGDTHTLSDFREYEALLVTFTCNHCPYAQAKFEALNQLAAEYDDVAVVGINSNDAEEYPEDSFDRMKELVADDTIRYDAYLRDESQDIARAYGAVCTPDPFLFENSETRSVVRDGEAVSSSRETPGVSRTTSTSVSGEEQSDEPRANGQFELVYHGRLDDAHDPEEEPSGEPGFEMRGVIESVLAGESVEREFLPSRGCSVKWK